MFVNGKLKLLIIKIIINGVSPKQYKWISNCPDKLRHLNTNVYRA